MNDDKQHGILVVFLFLAVLFLFGGFVLSQQKQKSPVDQVSSLDMGPTGIVPITPNPDEPIIASWQTYNNPQYNFSINVPAKWHVEDYQPAYATGGTLVAFSPEPLPCRTCAYFRNGYYSIRVFSQKTDADYYALFVQRMNNLGKNKEYMEVTIDGKKGVAFANTVAIESNGWVYELSLDKNNGNDSITTSKIFQTAAGSLQFTDLLLGN